MSVIDEETPLLRKTKLTTATRTPLPKLQIAILLVVQLCEPLASNSIFPYINQLIAELGVTGGDKRRVGYYAGLIESLFFATQAVTILQWGRLSDRAGRRPVLLIGMAGSALSILCFGLSRTFWGLVLSRCLCGMLNGNVGVMRSVIGEITDSTNRPEGLALISAAWNIGATVAPALGGSLSRPREHFPAVFASNFWKEYPYFLPCLVVAIYVSISFVAVFFFLKETNPQHSKSCVSPTSSATLAPISRPKVLPLREILTYPVIISISNYVAFSFLEISTAALLPLVMSTPMEYGGLGCSPAIIGYFLGALGAYLGIFQTLLFSKLLRRLGAKHALITGVLGITAINCLLLPLINLAIRRRGVDWVSWSILCSALVLRAGPSLSFGSISLYIMASAPSKSSLGATNGLALTMVSLSRAFGPGVAASLFAASIEKSLLGGYAVYAVLFIFSCMSLLLAILLPPQVWEESD